MTSDLVKSEVERQLTRLRFLPEHAQKAELANLRRGVGRTPGDLPELWGSFLLGMPEELQSATGDPTPGEWAVYLALTLYALHQQGHSLPAENMHKPGQGLGLAVRKLVKADEDPAKSSILKRFNMLATANTMPEISHHLRGIVQLLRSESIPMDYVRLATDLYYLQFTESAPRVRLKWGQDFYKEPAKSNAKDNKEESD